VDDKLQQVYVKQQKSYFKSSFDLKQELTSLVLPDNAMLFTSDAITIPATSTPCPRLVFIVVLVGATTLVSHSSSSQLKVKDRDKRCICFATFPAGPCKFER
jgi:hypothetical protein